MRSSGHCRYIQGDSKLLSGCPRIVKESPYNNLEATCTFMKMENDGVLRMSRRFRRGYRDERS
jgi:hypothetical protein